MAKLIRSTLCDGGSLRRLRRESKAYDASVWIVRVRSNFESEPVQKLARPLIAKYSSPTKPRNGLNGADPFIIAQARKNSPPWIVVSGEKGDANNPKIGYVCDQLNIKCVDFRGFWTNEGWTF